MKTETHLLRQLVSGAYHLVHRTSVRALLLMLVPTLAAPAISSAATHTVDSAANSGPGSLRQALIDAAEDDTIVFEGDLVIPVTGQALSPSNNTVSFIIKGTDPAAPPVLDGAGRVQLFSYAGSGTIGIDRMVFTGGMSKSDGGAIRNDTGSLSIANSRFEGNSGGRGGAVYNGAGVVRIRESSFVSNMIGDDLTTWSPDGMAVYNDTGTMFIESSTFANNSTLRDRTSGVVYNYKGYLEVNNTVFISNTGAADAGNNAPGLYNYSGTTIITSSTFVDNYSNWYGGAMLVNGDTPAPMVSASNVAFTGNYAGNRGGAIYYGGGGFDLQDSTFTSNTAAYTGGAIHGDAPMTLGDHLTFTGNEAGRKGGALYTFSDSMTVGDYAVFISNTAGAGTTAGEGGAIFSLDLVVLGSDAAFTGNYASDTGGAISAYQVALGDRAEFTGNIAETGEGGAISASIAATLGHDAVFTTNRAELSGGAIYVSGWYAILGDGAVFAGNTAVTGHGGAISADEGVFIGDNASFSHNTAGGNGGAIETRIGEVVIGDGMTPGITIIANNTAAQGRGGAIYAGGNITLAVAEGGMFSAYGNSAGGASGSGDDARGGFLYTRVGHIALNVGANASMIIGNADSIDLHTDSIASGTSTSSISKNGDGLLVLHADNSGFAGVFNLNEGAVLVSRTPNLFGGALNGAGTLVIHGADAYGDFVFSDAQVAGDFSGVLRLQGNTTLRLDDDNLLTLLARSTLELGADSTAIVDGANRSIANLRFDGGMLDLAAGAIDGLPDQPAFYVTGILTSGQGSVVIDTTALDSNSRLPADPPFPHQDIFAEQSTQIHNEAILLVGADSIEGDISQLNILDADHASLDTYGHKVAYHRDNGQYVLDATYDLTALTGTNASGQAGIFLSYNLVELHIHEEQTLRLEATGSASPALARALDPDAKNTLAAAVTGPGSLTISSFGSPHPEGYYLILSGENTYTGSTRITDGATLRAGAANVIAFSSKVTLDGAASKLELRGYDQLVQNLSGSGNIDLGTATLTVHNRESSLALTGTMVGSGGVVLSASSAWTLSATNAYTGPTTLEFGATLHAGTADIIATSSRVMLGTGATFDMHGFAQTLNALHGERGVIRYSAADGADTDYARLTVLGNLSGETTHQMNVDFLGSRSDTLVVEGELSGTHQVQFTPTSSAAPEGQHALEVITTGTTTATVTSPGLDLGMNHYAFQQGDGSALMPDANAYYLSGGRTPSRAADAILHTAGVMGTDWHYDLDNVHKRLGDIRSGVGGQSGTVWMRANTYRLTAGSSLGGSGFEQDTYGMTAGADKTFTLSGDSALATGLLVGISCTDRSFDGFGDGESSAAAVGAYALWMKTGGWFVDTVVKFDRYSNELNARSVDGLLTQAEYTSKVQGASVEFGRCLSKGCYWVEPTVQVAVGWLNGADYAASNGETEDLRVHIAGSTAWQYRGMVRAGADLGRWRPYVKFAMVNSDTDGGEVSVYDRSYQPSFDGWRFEAGAGVSCMIDPDSAVYLDYEYNRADKYERPWAVNLGYRRAW